MRIYEHSRFGETEDVEETARRLKSSIAAVRRSEYTDYDERGLRNLGKKIIADIFKEKIVRKKR